MSSAHFARTPNISIPRTKMKQTFQHKTSFEFGKLIPIDAFEVLPGDTFKLKLSSLIRMSTPIAPIMDNIECTIHAWFVPLRLIWEHAEEFFGANKETAGYQKTNYVLPYAQFIGRDGDDGVVAGSISDYLGKPITDNMSADNIYEANILKERAYCLIWNEWFRAEQIVNPVLINKEDVLGDYMSDGAVGIRNGEDVLCGSAGSALPVCKKFDYFTSATITPQYGEAVLLPLGTEAPVVADGPLEIATADDSTFFQGDTSAVAVEFDNPSGSGEKLATGGLIVDPDSERSNLYLGSGLKVDLSSAVAAKVNDIRYAFQVQKYLERSNFGANRFFEILQNHYGVSSPDARLQRPEYLGGHKFMININQVLSTAGATTGSDTKLGQPGAISTTGDNCSLFTKAFVEPGYVLITLNTKQDHTYSQGILREDSKRSRFEIYSPEFANLGDQEVLSKEIYVDGTEDDNDVFGYQEHWAEYRYRPDRVSGLLNPNVANSLDFWTLSDKFATRPVLDEDFIFENRENLTRALSTGETGPDFIADFYFDYTAVRPMPAYTIPGLIDHFGAM